MKMKWSYLLFMLMGIVLFGCAGEKTTVFTDVVDAIDEAEFQSEIDGEPVGLYTLTGENGIGMKVTNYGARIVALCVPDGNGHPVDVVLGYGNLNKYKALNIAFLGAAIGRYGNRIAQGKFTLDGQDYQLAQNDGVNHLHGGPTGYYNRVWTVDGVSKNKISLSYVSADQEEGYPGNLTISITYELTDDNAVKIEYAANTDKATICNLTNHSYFNLSGEGDETINDHVLTINSNFITPVDSTLIPTGERMPVQGTAFDFNQPTVIGQHINDENTQLKYGTGYDHNWILDKKIEGVELAASVYSPKTNIQMDVLTDQPGIQFYGGNFLKGTEIGKAGKPYVHRSAFCLETQHFPDSPNHLDFPSTTLRPGENYKHVCIYRFSVKK